jgi:hypothetical protein
MMALGTPKFACIATILSVSARRFVSADFRNCANLYFIDTDFYGSEESNLLLGERKI